MRAFRNLDRADVKDKRVLLRVDLNVPLKDGEVSDPTRLERVAPTITELADRGARVVLLSHLGRPKGVDPQQSLRPVAAALSRTLDRPVAFVTDCIATVAETAVANLRPGDILCLENTRFHPGEEGNDPDFVAALASLGDIFVNDAFSAAHRAHASTEGLGHRLPAYAGRNMERELAALEKALEAPERPLAAIVGGAKISTKLDLIGNLLTKVQTLIIGGAMANTFLAAQGVSVGKSLAEHDLVANARDIIARAKMSGCELILPVDAVVAKTFAARAPSRVVSIDAIEDDDIILDIGPRSAEQAISALAASRTLVWNGPFGAFELEPFDTGTIEVAEAVAELTQGRKLVSVAGGGDTVAALNHAGVTGRISYVSTAGGAFLEWLEGKALPGVEILRR